MALRFLKRVVFAIGSTIGLALVAFITYDVVEFQPRRPEIDALLTSASPLERTPPRLLPDLQRADAHGKIAVLATRSILFELDRNSERLRTVRRLWRELLWWQLVKIHLSEDEQFLAQRSRVYLGNDTHGFAAGAVSIFGRPLNELSDVELAELVVVARWPSQYRRAERADDLRDQAKRLLARVLSRS